MTSAAQRLAARRKAEWIEPLRMGADLRLEDLLTHRDGFALDTATPAQRAVCRIADGLPLGDLATNADVIRCVGDVASLPNEMPEEMTVVLGIRAFKSKLTAAAAIQATQICDLSFAESELRIAGIGECPRVPVLSLTTDLAHIVFGYVRGYVESKPALKALQIGNATADTITLRHPSGTPIEIMVSAGKRAGGSLVGRWLASVIFDEAPMMQGDEEAVVNLDDSLKAIRGRVLPKGKIWKVGSPWAPWGPIYDEVCKHEKKPTRKLVVVRGPAYLFNPFWWTPERCEELRVQEPDAYATNVEAEFVANVSTSALPADMVDACTGAELPPEDGMNYSAAIDPATRGNAWAIVIGHQDRKGRMVVDLVREWQGSKQQPLSTRTTIAECAAICKRYRVDAVNGDQWSIDAHAEIFADHGIRLRGMTLTGPDRARIVKTLLGWMSDRNCQWPAGVLPADLKRVKRKVANVGFTIDLPETGDGRHCDAAAAMFVLVHAGLQPADAQEVDKPARGTDEYWAAQAAEMKARALKRNEDKKERRWYEQ